MKKGGAESDKGQSFQVRNAVPDTTLQKSYQLLKEAKQQNDCCPFNCGETSDVQTHRLGGHGWSLDTGRTGTCDACLDATLRLKRGKQGAEVQTTVWTQPLKKDLPRNFFCPPHFPGPVWGALDCIGQYMGGNGTTEMDLDTKTLDAAFGTKPCKKLGARVKSS